MERMNEIPQPVTARPGERYAGIAFVDGKPSHHLFLLDAKPEAKMAWGDSRKWAESVGDGMPTRFESPLLFANLRDQFDTSEYHWTDTQCGDSDAYVQDFGDGYQGYLPQGNKFRARAVRRESL